MTGRVLITGNLGYVGRPLCDFLRVSRLRLELVGLDAGWFPVEERSVVHEQTIADLRGPLDAVLAGVDTVVHLAAVSNDPIGDRFAEATDAINVAASIRLAEAARRAGVRRFVFASSCSLYGQTPGRCTEETVPAPLTRYARSKVVMEDCLRSLARPDFEAVALRFATAAGASKNFRLDLVLNDFVHSAVCHGVVRVRSNGRAFRPLIDVADMARVIDWALDAPMPGGDPFLVVNAGDPENNVRIADLAAMVAAEIPGVRVEIATHLPDDPRSYEVDFGRLRKLAPELFPFLPLAGSLLEILSLLRRGEEPGPCARRLAWLEQRVAEGRMDEELRAQPAGVVA